MTADGRAAGLAIRVPTASWLVVDAVLDNEVAVASQTGDPSGTVDVARAVRSAGWSQVEGWPTDVAGFARWPAPGQESVVTLSAAEWRVVASTLRRWAAVPAGDRTDVLAIADLVDRHLAG